MTTLALVKLSAHLATNAFGPYEFHRDEFLYMAMGRHLRLWAMDFPPAIAILAELSRWMLGDSIIALRLVPALASTALLVLAAVSARELGGGRFAQGLAASAVLFNPLFLRSGTLFQPVVLDQLWWTLGLLALLELERSDDRRWWLVFGMACGVGLLSKFSMLVFGFATLLGILASRRRDALVTPWPWIAAVLAFVIGSPSVVGQIRLGFPIFDQLGDLQQAQLARVTPADFLMDQVTLGPTTALALLGLIALLFGHAWSRFRLIGWSCLLAFATLIVLRGKGYYIGPVYPMLVAAGAVVVERIPYPQWGRIARWGTAGAIVAYGLAVLPLGLPLLGPTAMEQYLIMLGSDRAVTTNVGEQERLPQDYADMLNWNAQVREIARVYDSLPPEEQARVVLLASNYGEAGAIDFYGPRFRLPPAIALVGTYWFFGPGQRPGEVTIAIGFDRDDLAGFFDTVIPAGRVTHSYAVAEERDLTIYVCRDPEVTFQKIWPSWAGRQ